MKDRSSHWHTFVGIPAQALRAPLDALRLPRITGRLTAERLIDGVLRAVAPRGKGGDGATTAPKCMNFIATCIFVMADCIGYLVTFTLISHLYIAHRSVEDEDDVPTVWLQLASLAMNAVVMYVVFSLLHDSHPYIVKPHAHFRLLYVVCMALTRVDTATVTWRRSEDN